MTQLIEILEKVRDQLDWRGPSGSVQDRIVLERNDMRALFDAVDEIVQENRRFSDDVNQRSLF